MNAKIFVSHLEDKQPIQSVFQIKEKFLLKGKNGKAYISVALADRSGSVDGRIWDNVDDLAHTFQTGDFVRVKGQVQLFQNRKQVVVHKVEKAQAGEYDLKDFIQVASEPPEQMFAKLKALVGDISDPYIRTLTLAAIDDPEIHPRLLQSPAAKTIHHAYWGGLLEHILSICQVMTFLAEHYPQLNRDLLYFGAIFHDIGKIWELDYEAGTSYTDSGRMLGHLVMGVELVEKLARGIEGFPDELKMVLKHIVLSHHGRLEYGSPKTPQFLEAFVVAFVDDIDSKINTLTGYLNLERQSGEKWSRFNQLFDRYFYLGIDKSRAYSLKPNSESDGLLIPQGHAGLSYKKPED